jgi:cathepsin X
MLSAIVCLLSLTSIYSYRNEVVKMPLSGKSSNNLPLPSDYIEVSALPASFSWGNVNNKSFLTKTLNQHLPQYCGSCWAHGAASALADRIKIADGNAGETEINLSIQYILNCGANSAGTCNGGDQGAAYEFIQSSGGIPYDTCQPYMACSYDSSEGFCSNADWTCSAINTCRTCSTFTADGGKCVALDTYPNATVSAYAQVTGESAMMAELYARGPLACGIYAQPLVDYKGGIVTSAAGEGSIDHIISVVGWGIEGTQKYWIVRNSWGQYWGEMGFVRVAKGDNTLNLESYCYWATPGKWTTSNSPCYEDGTNCVPTSKGTYVDPSETGIPYGQKHSQL